MDIKAYWKSYHEKNKDRINKARRDRYKSSKPVVTKPTIEPIKKVYVTLPIKSGLKCIYCWDTETELMNIQGGDYPVCQKHRNKAT